MKISEALVVSGLLVASLGLAACGSEDEGETTGTSCPKESTLGYANFGQVFFQENCLSCHGAGGPQEPKFTTVEQIRENASRIDAVAAAGPQGVNTFMPQGRSVPTSEREKLGEWLACGAPD
ncbi:MAG: cytochrome c [Myxococcales bacterium]|nr:MAG: cytochrome c [Myxococcales bacterium]